MAMSNSVHSSPGSSVRSVERVFEDAQASGELHINSRKMKEFPIISCKYDLSDVAYADLSKNRLSDLPEAICNYLLLEQLDCYNNIIRFIPDAIVNLQALTFLDLSRNQLTYIPVALCHLQLQVCILRNNRLVSIPEEISSLKSLRDLDVSCNEITLIPPQIGSVITLQNLNLRRNLLVELPLEMCQLKLISLDISGNRISALPTHLRHMVSLQDLLLDHNPMTFPPAILCRRGRIHVFKFLEIQAIKEDKRGIVLDNEFKKFRSPSILSDARFQNGFAAASCRKSYTFDSGYSTSDCDSRSQESQELSCGFKRYPIESPNKWDNTSHPGRTQNSSCEERITEEFGADALLGNGKAHHSHIQTYREYKEALRQQRSSDVMNVYKKQSSSSLDNNFVVDSSGPKIPVQQAETSVSVKYTASPGALPTSVEVELKEKHHTVLVSQTQLPPVVVEPYSNDDRQKQTSTPKNFVNFEKKTPSTPVSDTDSVNGRLNFMWPKSSLGAKPVKSSFTMRREFDKAREELELTSHLRENLENRLKLKLPEEMEPALYDGVFLCHLANQIQPNSVACIHVPSAAVPKLTVAKCRRNVDNFLEACRRMGVPNAPLQRRDESGIDLNQAFQTSTFDRRAKKSLRSPFKEFLLNCFLAVVFLSTLVFLYLYPST